ncbi:MAG: hypothetical protein ACREOK_05520 [Gemmatimonadaceae bacterium]
MFRNIRARFGGAVALAAIVAACSSLGSVGDILGGVLGGGGGQVNGTVRNVNTQSQSLTLQQSNGQDVDLQFDNQTRVVYQNQAYSVASLDPGDQVAARVQQLQSGAYYTDSIVVVQPVNNTGGTVGGGAVQSLQGTVRQIDRNNGLFTIDAGGSVSLTVSLPYNASSTTVQRFNNLRSGDYVRFQGVYISQTRVELRQFS